MTYKPLEVETEEGGDEECEPEEGRNYETHPKDASLTWVDEVLGPTLPEREAGQMMKRVGMQRGA